MATIALEPELEPLLWYSYSVDLRGERDLRGLEVAGIWVRKAGLSWQRVKVEADVVYGWLFILNNGEGAAHLSDISSFRYNVEDKVMASELWSDSVVLRTGQALAIFLGPCGQVLHTEDGEILKLKVHPESIGDIQVSYKTSVPSSARKVVTLRLPTLWVKSLGEQAPEWTW